MCKLVNEKSLQITAIIIALAGTYVLAFGLKVKSGIDPKYEKELRLDNKTIAPSQCNQKGGFVFWGLFLISISAILQIILIFCKT